MFSLQEIQAMLATIQGCSFAGLDTATIPVLTGGKKNPMQGKIIKRCIGHNVMLFTNTNSSGYENKVKRHLEASGLDPNGWTMGELPWGKRLPNSPIIDNNGKYYLQAVFLKAGVTQYFATDEIELNNQPHIFVRYKEGELIPKANIPGLKDTTGSEGQGLERDKQVIVRTYALDSILAIRAENKELVND